MQIDGEEIGEFVMNPVFTRMGLAFVGAVVILLIAAYLW